MTDLPSSLSPYFEGWFASLNSDVPFGTYLERIGVADRALQLTAQQVAGLTMRTRSAIRPAWLHNPAPGTYNTLTDGVFAAVWSYYASGDAFLLVTSRYADGNPASWVVLDPRFVDVRRMPVTGRRFYTSGQVELGTDDVLQITRNVRAGALRGTGALASFWSNLKSAWSSNRYTADVLDRSGISPALLKKTGGRLAEGQAVEVREQWVRQSADRAGAPLVIDGEFDYSLLAFNPEQMMLLGIREFDSKMIATAFGVPSVLLNLPGPGGLTYANVSHLYDLWWRSELKFTAGKITGALSTWLPRGSWCEYDPTSITSPDFATNSATWLALQAAGVVTVDEVRAAVLDLPPLGDGDQAEELFTPNEADTTPAEEPESMEVPV